MPAYDRVSSGIVKLDEVIGHIRPGDNVIWQLADISDYRHFTVPFIANALKTGRNIVYLRFAAHPPVLDGHEGVKVYPLDVNCGFEGFTVEVHKIISREGRETFYVFDSLSELQTAWAADLMMGNFFTVTCPYLFEMDTVAYFAILRNKHSFDTIARIRDTTQLLVDVYSSGTKLYIHPLKVWNRYSPTMFLPHVFENGELLPLTDGVETGRFFSLVAGQGLKQSGHKLDYWDRIFLKAEMLDDNRGDSDDSGNSGNSGAYGHESAGMPGGSRDGGCTRNEGNTQNDGGARDAERAEMLERLCKLVIGREKGILGLALKYFGLRDLIKIGKDDRFGIYRRKSRRHASVKENGRKRRTGIGNARFLLYRFGRILYIHSAERLVEAQA